MHSAMPIVLPDRSNQRIPDPPGPAPLPLLPPIPDGDPQIVALQLLAQVAGGRAIADLEGELQRIDRSAGAVLQRLVDVAADDLPSKLLHVLIAVVRAETSRRVYAGRLRQLGGEAPMPTLGVAETVAAAVRAVRSDLDDVAWTLLNREAGRLGEAEFKLQVAVSQARSPRANSPNGFTQDRWLEATVPLVVARQRALLAATATETSDPLVLAAECLSTV